MSTEQQIASVVIGWVLIAMAAGAAWFVRWTDKRHAERQARDQAGALLPEPSSRGLSSVASRPLKKASLFPCLRLPGNSSRARFARS